MRCYANVPHSIQRQSAGLVTDVDRDGDLSDHYATIFDPATKKAQQHDSFLYRFPQLLLLHPRLNGRTELIRI